MPSPGSIIRDQAAAGLPDAGTFLAIVVVRVGFVYPERRGVLAEEVEEVEEAIEEAEEPVVLGE